MTTVADSTVGLALFNALSLLGRAASLDEIMRVNRQQFDFSAPLKQWRRAADRLVALRRVTADPECGALRSRAPAGSIVRLRHRGGDGWNGWVADVPGSGRLLLDEVIR